MRNIEGCFLMIQVSIHKENITIINNMYLKTELQKQKVIELKKEIDNSQ